MANYKGDDMILGRRIYCAVRKQGETVRDIVHLSYREQVARVQRYAEENHEETGDMTNNDLYKALWRYALALYKNSLGVD
jgi:hypothetical protein